VYGRGLYFAPQWPQVQTWMLAVYSIYNARFRTDEMSLKSAESALKSAPIRVKRIFEAFSPIIKKNNRQKKHHEKFSFTKKRRIFAGRFF
jgi:predicted nucleotide-binding protein (sugar kinase/HSP70/actin superfamily)